MRKNMLTLSEIKEKIFDIKGKNIDVSINKGRKRIVNYSGIVENTYPSVFTIKIFNDSNLKNVTCSYSDVLCGYVKIQEK